MILVLNPEDAVSGPIERWFLPVGLEAGCPLCGSSQEEYYQNGAPQKRVRGSRLGAIDRGIRLLRIRQIHVARTSVPAGVGDTLAEPTHENLTPIRPPPGQSRIRRPRICGAARRSPDHAFGVSLDGAAHRGVVAEGLSGGALSHHSATVPSAVRQIGLRQRCPAFAAARTFASSISIPRPGPVRRWTKPSRYSKTRGSTR